MAEEFQLEGEVERDFLIKISMGGVDRLVRCTPEVVESLNSDDPMVRQQAYSTIYDSGCFGEAPHPLQSTSAHDDSGCLGEVTHPLQSTSTQDDSGGLGEASQKSNVFDKTTSRCLIAMYVERIEKFLSPKYRNKVLWAEIAQELSFACNKTYLVQQVEGRWKTLVAAYKRHKTNQNKSGEGKKSFEYEEEMAAALGDRHDVTPVFVSESGTTSSAEKEKHVNEASSSEESEKSRGTSSAEKEKRVNEASSSEEGEKPRKRQRGNAQIVELLKDIVEKDERRSQERFNAVQNMHNEKMDVFKSLIDVLKDKK